MSQSKANVADLESLVSRTDKLVDGVQSSDALSQIADVQSQIEEAQNIADKTERDRRLEILNANMKDLRQKVQAEQTDLAEAVLGLNIMIESMGAGYGELTQLSADEQKIIEDAEALVPVREAELKEVESSFWPFGKDAKIAAAKEAIETARQGIKDAQVEANKKMRARLMNASMEDSLQEFQLKVERTVQIMKNRLEDIKVQVAAVGERKNKAFEAKEIAARELQEASVEVEELESQLYDAEEELGSYSNGTSEYTAQEQKISELKAKLEDARGKRDVATGVFQSKEKFAKELEVHEAAQKKLRNNQQSWIKTLESDTEERVITFKSRLEAMKASSDQEIAKQLDDMGAEVDQNNADFMAQVTVASDKIMAAKVGAHPERLRKMTEAQSALSEHIYHAEQDMKDMVSRLQENYGIDPTKSQFAS